ncbi:MAG: PAS domain S-box protein [Bacteroidales bacterium]|nr:PAS domain S-box protein [Bacteroidales bacterium]
MGKKVSHSINGTRERIKSDAENLKSSSYVKLLENRIDDLEKENYRLKTGNTSNEKVQRALAESEERYKTLTRISANIIIVIKNHRIVFANPSFLGIMGFSDEDELLDNEPTAFFDPSEYNDLLIKYQRLTTGRSTEKAQLKLVKKDGSKIVIGFTSVPVKYGEEPAIMLIGENFTPWKESEKALRESEQKLKAFFDCAPDCIIITDLGHTIRYFNRPLAEYAVNEMLNLNFFDLVDSRYEGIARESFENISDNSETSTFEFRPKKARLMTWLRCRIALLSYGNTSAGYIITLTDITKQKESEFLLAESEQRYMLLFDNINSGVIILKADDKGEDFLIKDINKAALKIIRKNKDEVKLKAISEIVPGYEKSGVTDKIRAVYKTGEPHFFPVTLYDTELFTGWLEHYLYKISGGEVILVVEDITEKHLAAAELKSARQEWQDIFEAIGQPALILDKHHNIINANNSVIKITGKSREELSGHKCYELFHAGAKQPPAGCPLKSLLGSKTFESQEMEIEALGGTYMVSCTPILDDSGMIQKIIHIATDITEIKKAKNELSASLARYRKLLDTIPYGIDEIDLHGNIKITNSAHTKMLGYGAGEIAKMSIFDLQAEPENKEALRAYLLKLIKERPAPVPYYSRNINSAGSFVDVQVDWNYLEDEKGQLEGFISVISDITQRLKAERELLVAKEKAEESDRLKSAFLANISHEVRTPLNGIIGFAAMLKNEKVPFEKRKEYSNFVQKSANQLLNIINDLIDISRIQSGQLSISAKKFNLSILMVELFEHFQNNLKETGKEEIELILNTTYDNDFYVESDEVKLRQVLINLLSNAVKFTKSGKIEFGYKTVSESQLQFFVKDTGIGIAKNNLDVIFEKFRQEDDSFVREYGGAGLGLAISKGIIEKMGGSIWVESVKDKGSVFYFSIPYAISVSKVTDDTEGQSKYKWNGTSVLVVEDDPLNTELIKATFKYTGAQFLYAKDGEEALKIFKENPQTDIVLLDIRLPYLDGYSVARQMKSTSPGVIIIAHTAYAREAEKSINGENLLDGFIAKPALPIEILEYVNNFVTRKSE